MKLTFLAALLAILTAQVATAAEPPTPDDANTASSAEESGPHGDYIGPLIHPEGPGVGNWRFAVGGFIEVVPSQVLEAAPPTVPRFTFDTRYDITENIGFVGAFSTQVVQNELSIGMAVFEVWDEWSFLIGTNIGGYFGTMGQLGFDTTVYGSLLRSYVRGGYCWGDLNMTLMLESWFYLNEYTKIGDSVTRDPSGFQVAATQLSLTFESYLSNGNIIWFAMGAIVADPNYVLWQVVSDEQQRLLYPRFLLAYEF